MTHALAKLATAEGAVASIPVYAL